MKSILLIIATLYSLTLHASASNAVFSHVFKPQVGTWNDDEEATLVKQLMSDAVKGLGCHYQIDNQVFRYDYYISKDKKLGCEKRTDKLSGGYGFFCFHGYQYQNGKLDMVTIDQITDNGAIHNIRIDLEGHCL